MIAVVMAKDIDDDGDTDISTHKFLVFLPITLIAIFLLVYPRFNFVSNARKLGNTYTYLSYSYIISIE